jgi:hypothetical protein
MVNLVWPSIEDAYDVLNSITHITVNKLERTQQKFSLSVLIFFKK